MNACSTVLQKSHLSCVVWALNDDLANNLLTKNIYRPILKRNKERPIKPFLGSRVCSRPPHLTAMHDNTQTNKPVRHDSRVCALSTNHMLPIRPHQALPSARINFFTVSLFFQIYIAYLKYKEDLWSKVIHITTKKREQSIYFFPCSHFVHNHTMFWKLHVVKVGLIIYSVANFFTGENTEIYLLV